MDNNVLRLRQDFVARIILRIRALVAEGAPEEAEAAVEELTRYFLWVKDSFSPDVQEKLSRQVRDLRFIAENLRNDLGPAW